MRRGSLRIAAAIFWSSTTISIFFSNGSRANRRRRSRLFRKTVSAALPAILVFIDLFLEALKLFGQPEGFQDPVENTPVNLRFVQKPYDPPIALALMVPRWVIFAISGYASGDLEPGMVVLFPREGYRYLLTKRIIALENQTVAVNEQGTFINGEIIPEPNAFYSGEKPSGINKPHGTSEVETLGIPPGKVFVMGDNRDNSFDSRDPEFGFVDVNDIVGQPLMVLWAGDKSRIGKLIR